MKFSLAVLCLASSLALAQVPPPVAPSGPIIITLSDGKEVTASAARKNDKSLMARVEVGPGVTAEINLPIANVKSVVFPEPPALKEGNALKDAGKSAEALAKIESTLAAQADFNGIEGNWWAPAMLLKIRLLIDLERDREAEAQIGILASATKDANALLESRMALAVLWTRRGKSKEALAVFDKVIAEGDQPGLLAMAWLNKGEALLSLKQYDPALLAFLRVPVLYQLESRLIPPALLGSARAYIGLNHREDAMRTLRTIIEKYPSTAEAAAAKPELKTMEDNPLIGASPSA